MPSDQASSAVQYRTKPAVRIERDPSVLRVLGVGAANDELVLRPVDVAVLNAQHLALTTARLERADDAVVHRRPDECVLRDVHFGTREHYGLAPRYRAACADLISAPYTVGIVIVRHVFYRRAEQFL